MTKKLAGRSLSSYLQSLPTFSDNPNEDAIKWLNDITNRFNYIDFTDDQKVSFISGYLDGTARSWLLANVPVVNTWTTFVQAFKKEFAPMWLKEDTMFQVNQCVSTMDKTMICDDDDINEEQTYELLQENKVNLDCSNIILAESNYIVSLNTCSVESSGNNCKSVWPDGYESWFIHDELPQRCQFIQPKPSTSHLMTSTVPDLEHQVVKQFHLQQSDQLVKYLLFSESCFQYVLNRITVFSAKCAYRDQKVFSLPSPTVSFNDSLNSYNVQLAPLDIILLTFMFLSVVFTNLDASLMFFNGTVNSFLVKRLVLYDINSFEWFRTLAVP